MEQHHGQHRDGAQALDVGAETCPLGWTAVAATGVGDGAVGSARWIDDDMRAMMLR
ncbi:hypothetical protein GS881_24605 [Rhodococcus hoagii]|nr:hypothetical protein [Prescottella equi]